MNDTVKPIHAKPAMYAFFYEELKVIAKEYGYNLVLHGSMNRDLDLIAIPWVDEPKDEFLMIQHFERFLRGVHSEEKSHYLLAYSTALLCLRLIFLKK